MFFPTRSSNFAKLMAATGMLGLLGVGVALHFLRAAPFNWISPALAAVYALWLLSEWRISAGDKSRELQHDKLTCESYAVARLLTMVAAFLPAPLWTSIGPWLPIGAGLFVAGVLVRAWAIRSLGEAYSHRVRTPDGSVIVSHGPYRLLRHPAYAGMLLANIGVATLLFNPFVVAALAFAFVPAVVRRIRVEEAHLLAMPDYQAFATQRARLVPGVW